MCSAIGCVCVSVCVCITPKPCKDPHKHAGKPGPNSLCFATIDIKRVRSHSQAAKREAEQELQRAMQSSSWTKPGMSQCLPLLPRMYKNPVKTRWIRGNIPASLMVNRRYSPTRFPSLPTKPHTMAQLSDGCTAWSRKRDQVPSGDSGRGSARSSCCSR